MGTKSQTEEVVDDWALPCEFHLFAQHEEHVVTYSAADDNGNSGLLRMLFVEHMTPVDMLQLGNGVHDSTGHCVWTGAYVFLQALVRLDEVYGCFNDCRVLELGCGPGMAGLAVALRYEHVFVSFTDADPDALDLCRKNCVVNQLNVDEYSVELHTWGTVDSAGDKDSTFDTVIATDVIYDITIVPLLFASAHRCCKVGGYFVLVHVPRACYTSDRPKEENESLEDYIASQADGFKLCRMWRISEFDQVKVRVDDKLVAHRSLQGETGAAVLVFHKEDATS